MTSFSEASDAEIYRAIGQKVAALIAREKGEIHEFKESNAWLYEALGRRTADQIRQKRSAAQFREPSNVDPKIAADLLEIAQSQYDGKLDTVIDYANQGDDTIALGIDTSDGGVTKYVGIKISPDGGISYKLVTPQAQAQSDFSDPWGSLDFAELSPDIKQELEEILHPYPYSDTIDAILDAKVEPNGDVLCLFKDGRKYLAAKLPLKGDIQIRVVNARQVENFSEDDDSYDFAQKNCTKGIPCGGSCIAASKTCKKAPNPHQQQQIAAVSAQLSGTAPPAAKTPKKPKQAKKAPPLLPAPVPPPAPKAPPAPVNPLKTNQSELDKSRADLEKRFGKKLVEDAEVNTKKILDNSDVFIRVGSSDTLGLILSSEFKTAHQLGRTEHDIPHLKDDYLSARARVEQKSMGVDPKTADGDRPIYGYLGGKDLSGESHASVDQAYGTIAVKLKPEVKDRTTFTGADSFKSGIASQIVNPGTPPPPNAASLVTSTRHGYDLADLPAHYPSYMRSPAGQKSQLEAAAKAKSIDDLAPALAPTGNRYVEAQVFGGVKPQDIAELHFQPRRANEYPSPEVAQWAKANNVPILIHGKKVNPDDIIRDHADTRSPRLKDLSEALDKGDFAKVLDHTENLHADAQKQSMKPGERDKVLKQLYQDAGFDGAPSVVSKSEIDQMAGEGATLVTRGVKDAPNITAQQQTQQFKTGDYFTGNGIYGNGTYTGHSGGFDPDGLKFLPGNDARGSKDAARAVAKHGYIVSEAAGGASMRMALPVHAKVITGKQQQEDIRSTVEKMDKWAASERSKIIATGTTISKKDVSKVEAEAKKIEQSYAGKLGKPGKSTVLGMDGRGDDLVEVSISVKGDAPLKVRISREDDVFASLLGGSTKPTYHYYDASGQKHSSKRRQDVIDLALKDAYKQRAAEKLGYPEVPVAGQPDHVTKAKVSAFDDRVERAKKTMGLIDDHNDQSDLGGGTSGRFAVIRGVDAVALNNSYEPDRFMNLLNRTIVKVQQDNPKYVDLMKKGVAP